MTIIDNLSRLTRPQPQLTLEVFPRKRVNLEPESTFYPWSAVFSLHFIPSLQSAVCSLRFTLTDQVLWPCTTYLDRVWDID